MRKLDGLFPGLLVGFALGLAAVFVLPVGVADAGNGKKLERQLERRFSKLQRRADRRGIVEGTSLGVVTDNVDPDELGRVQVRFPWLAPDDTGVWARRLGGRDGALFLPEVEDEVIVAFLHGDIRYPVVIGTVWNGADTPPRDN